MATKIQLRRGTAAQWTSANPVLAAGEIGLETDTDKRKIGDGVQAWTALGYDLTRSVADDLYAGATETADALAGKASTAAVSSLADEVDTKVTADGAVTAVVGSTAWSASQKVLLNRNSMLGQPIRMAALGASMSSDSSAPPYRLWGWANVLSHGALLRSGDGWSAGVGGETSAQILARVGDILALSPKPHICFVDVGTNDLRLGVPLATTKANLVAIYALLIAAGIQPIAICIPPLDTVGRTSVPLLNAWISAYAAWNGIPCLDHYTLFANPDGTWRAGYSTDGIHPLPIAARIMGQQAADMLASGRTLAPMLAGYSGTDTTNLIINGTFTGDSNGDGIANSWNWNTPGAHATPSLVPGTGGVIGNWQQVVKTSTGNNYISPLTAITTGWSVGDTMLFCGRVKLEDVGNSFGLSVYVQEATSAIDYLLFQWTAELSADDEAIFSHAFKVPAGVTSLSPRIVGSGGGTGTWAIAQWALRNLTALSIA